MPEITVNVGFDFERPDAACEANRDPELHGREHLVDESRATDAHAQNCGHGLPNRFSSSMSVKGVLHQLRVVLPHWRWFWPRDKRDTEGICMHFRVSVKR